MSKYWNIKPGLHRVSSNHCGNTFDFGIKLTRTIFRTLMSCIAGPKLLLICVHMI